MEANNENFIQVNGIMNPKRESYLQAVMLDNRLTIEAKAIYAYIFSFIDFGLSEIPTVKVQLKELGISSGRYYKHRKLLEDLGYIKIEQTKIKGESGRVVNGKNIYTIELFPVEK